MKRNFLSILLAVFLVINLSAFATFTYHRCCGRPESCAARQSKSEGIFLCQELSLTDSQITDMKNKSAAFHTIADSINRNLNADRSELIKLLAEEPADLVKIEQQVDKVNSLQASLQKQVIYYLLQRKEILNAEQQKKFLTILKNRFDREAKCNCSSELNLLSESGKKECQQSTNCTNK